MSCAFTTCNDCGHVANHMTLTKCPKCGSYNVEIDTEIIDFSETGPYDDRDAEVSDDRD